MEQVYPSSESTNGKTKGGGIAMVKRVQNSLMNFYSVSLVIIGWVAFAFGIYIDGPIGLKLVLLTAARVLP